MAKRTYTAEYRREAVRHARQPGVALVQAARDLGLHPNVLRGLCRKADAGELESGSGADVKESQAREIARLKRELNRVTMERDILKKATAYFAKESK